MVGLKANADLFPLFHIVVHCSELNKQKQSHALQVSTSFTCGT